MAGDICDVCGEEFKGEHDLMVASSSLGPVSFAYCRECSRRSLEPYVACVGGCAGMTKETMDPWVWKNILVPSLEFHGVTPEQFWVEVQDETAGQAAERFVAGQDHVKSGLAPLPFDPQDLGPIENTD